jgi:NitT/TauT family transport system substrate-binding protein
VIAAGCASGSAKATNGSANVSLLLNTPASGINAAAYEADKLGYYQDQHLNVTIVPGESTQQTIEDVAQNKATIGFAIPENVLQSGAAGTDVVSVGNAFGRNAQGLFVARSSGITSLKQLQHKTILVLAAQFEDTLKSLLTSAGANPNTNTYVVVSSAPTMIQMYLAGRADAVMTQIPYGAPLIDGKRASNEIFETSYGLAQPQYGFIVSKQTLASDASVIERFLKATYQGYAAANKNPEQAGEAEASYVPEVTASTVAAQYKEYIPYECSPAQTGKNMAYQPASDWKSMTNSLTEIGVVPNSLDESQFYTNQFEATGASVQCK